MARYVVRRPYFLPYVPNTASAPFDRFDQGKPRAQWNHHKIPEISICRTKRKNAGKVFRIQLIGPPRQMKQMKQKECS